MTGWILAVLGLFVVQTLLPNIARAASGDAAQRAWLGGNRDGAPPPHTLMSGRMERALHNMFEALVVFLPLALLAVVTQTGGWATTGAAVFCLARVAYVPAYGSGIAPLRSLVWTIGHIGLGLMVYGLLAGG